MKFLAVAALFAGAVVAVPTDGDAPEPVCPSPLYPKALCCASLVLDVVGMGCGAPSEVLDNAKQFHEICHRSGKQAGCCTIEVRGSMPLCVKPRGAA